MLHSFYQYQSYSTDNNTRYTTYECFVLDFFKNSILDLPSTKRVVYFRGNNYRFRTVLGSNRVPGLLCCFSAVSRRKRVS